uniref:Reverse transcriptase domain-containing protein n=1 Tax=Neogobius melanostomus TaxID=47308 RepID=A0A8C6S964_9GOBI
MMASHIKMSNFQGINAFDREFKISQLADDTAVFINNPTNVSIAVECINEFSEVSGLRMNLNKSVLLPLKNCDDLEIHGIPVKRTITYLGVVLNSNQILRCSLNFDPIINQITTKFNMWLMRDLSIYGRVLLSKAEGISRSVYISLSINMPQKVCTKLDKLLYNFIWKNKAHYLKKDVLCNQRGNGGLEVLSFETVNNVFKIKWISQLVKGKINIWNAIPKYIFNQIGGIEFLLKCNYKPEKLPIKLSDFHKQVLLSWRLMYKHNFSPTRCYIWNNQYIKHRNKTLFLKTWFDNGIIWTNQLINQQGQAFSYDEFITLYKFPILPREYAQVCKSIPKGIMCLLKNHQFNNETQKIQNKLYIGEIDIIKRTCPNKYIRNLIQPLQRPVATSHWNSVFGEINWSRAWLAGERLCVFNNVKEISFKILHNIYPVKKTLERFKLDIDYKCDFCQAEQETIIHLFYHCTYSQNLWLHIQQLIQNKTGYMISLQESDILFYFDNPNIPNDLSLLIQTIIHLAKYHIHKTKWAQTKPNGLHLINELNQYLKTIKTVTNQKAIKVHDASCKYHLI